VIEEGDDSNPVDQSLNVDLHLADAKGFEDRLMNRVKEALRAIIDQQIKDNESNREAYTELDK
jgi:hypothetical protein